MMRSERRWNAALAEHESVVRDFLEVCERCTSSDWQVLSHGSTIGYAKLDRFEPVTVRRVRLAIEDAAGMPQGIAVKLYNPFVP